MQTPTSGGRANFDANGPTLDLYLLDDSGETNYVDKHQFNYAALQSALNYVASHYLLRSLKDQPNGYAGLDENGKLTASTLPLPMSEYVTRAEVLQTHCVSDPNDGSPVIKIDPTAQGLWDVELNGIFSMSYTTHFANWGQVEIRAHRGAPYGYATLENPTAVYGYQQAHGNRGNYVPRWQLPTVCGTASASPRPVLLEWGEANVAGGFPSINWTSGKMDYRFMPFPDQKLYQRKNVKGLWGGYVPLDDEGKIPMEHFNLRTLRQALGLPPLGYVPPTG